MSAFKFLAPYWLLLMPALWWMVWLFAQNRRRKSGWSRLCDPHLLDYLLANQAKVIAQRWVLWPLTLVLSLGILAAAGPSWRPQSSAIMQSTQARIVVLDLSQSMLVEDIKPNRFTHALSAVRELLSSDYDGESGLVVFAGAAFVVSPLSRDSKTLLAFVDALDPSTMPIDGSRIDLAIRAAQNLLDASISGHGQILVFTAGNAKAGEAIEGAIEAAMTARQRGYRVSVMAIGTAEGGPLVKPKGGLWRDTQGQIQLAKPNFAELQQIARAGQGSMVTLTRSSTPSEVFISMLKASELSEAKSTTGNEDRDAANEGIWLIWLMLPLSLLLFRKNLIWSVMFFIALPNLRQAHAQDWDGLWNHPEHLAYQAYQLGQYQRCGELSGNSLLKGAAYYKNGQYELALEQFSQDHSAAAFYNLGNTWVQLTKLTEAIDAYSRALSLDPNLEQARYNKRLIELYLEQNSAGGSESSAESQAGESSEEPPDQSSAENRIGMVGQFQVHPGDAPQVGPGLGASLQSGIPGLVEQFDSRQQQLERFSQSQGNEQTLEHEQVERWIKSLPAASSDLFRRKFLRDYQQQTRTQR